MYERPYLWDTAAAVREVTNSNTCVCVCVCFLPGEGQKLQDTEEHSEAVVLPLQRHNNTNQTQKQHNTTCCIQTFHRSLFLTQNAAQSVSTRHTCRERQFHSGGAYRWISATCRSSGRHVAFPVNSCKLSFWSMFGQIMREISFINIDKAKMIHSVIKRLNWSSSSSAVTSSSALTWIQKLDTLN